MKNNRKEITILSLVIVFVLTILLSSSYAWFTVTAESNNTTTIKVGDLNLAFTDNNQDVELLNKTPISIDDAFEEDGYTFTLTNTGSIKSKYTVVLEDKELNDGESRLDNKYVRYILKSGNSTKIGFISDLVEGKLVEGILVKNGEVTYNLKLFLDEDTFDKDAAGKILKKEIKISAEQDNSDVSANKILTPMANITVTPGSNESLDEIKIGTEEFYILANNNEQLTLLAKGVLTSNYIQGTEDYLKVSYSDTNYWSGKVGTGLQYPGNYENGLYPYVYDENSHVYQVVNTYANKIKEFGIDKTSGRLITYDEGNALSEKIRKVDRKITYWTGSAKADDRMWTVAASTMSFVMAYTSEYYVRPVVIIPSYYLKLDS